jgi:hypothetical protein
MDLAGSDSVPAATCNGDCLVTQEFTPIEPGVYEYKYYAPGVGSWRWIWKETAKS